MPMMTFRQALRQALREEMLRDSRVFLFGEEVAIYGGTYKVTEGLQAEFGPDRIFDTPISESALMGAAVGAALEGRIPVLEIMYGDFATIAMDHLVNTAAKMHYLYGGRLSVPLVVRMAFGAGVHQGPQHSQSPEAWIANIPGLIIVMPSNPHDAKGLLKSAIRDPNPVVFLEQKTLYPKAAEVPEAEYLVPLGQAEVKREGRDATVVATGATVDKALAAAASLEKDGISLEVVDLRTIVPMDEATVVASVKKTGRLVVVHEAPVKFGIGAEVAAVAAEKAFGYLDAPIRRVGAPFTPVPLSQSLESAYVVTEQKITAAVKATLA